MSGEDGTFHGVPTSELIATAAIFNRIFDESNNTIKVDSEEQVAIDPSTGEKIDINPTEYVGLSTSNKPTTELNLFDRFIEYDTLNIFVWDGTEWIEIS